MPRWSTADEKPAGITSAAASSPLRTSEAASAVEVSLLTVMTCLSWGASRAFTSWAATGP